MGFMDFALMMRNHLQEVELEDDEESIVHFMFELFDKNRNGFIR